MHQKMTFLKISKNLVRGTPEDAKKPILRPKIDSVTKAHVKLPFWPFLGTKMAHGTKSPGTKKCAEILRGT